MLCFEKTLSSFRNHTVLLFRNRALPLFGNKTLVLFRSTTLLSLRRHICDEQGIALVRNKTNFLCEYKTQSLLTRRTLLLFRSNTLLVFESNALRVQKSIMLRQTTGYRDRGLLATVIRGHIPAWYNSVKNHESWIPAASCSAHYISDKNARGSVGQWTVCRPSWKIWSQTSQTETTLQTSLDSEHEFPQRGDPADRNSLQLYL